MVRFLSHGLKRINLKEVTNRLTRQGRLVNVDQRGQSLQVVSQNLNQITHPRQATCHA